MSDLETGHSSETLKTVCSSPEAVISRAYLHPSFHASYVSFGPHVSFAIGP